MNNHKLKKNSIKLIPRSQNSFISVRGTLSVLQETKEHFANAMFYVVKNNVANIISGDLAVQLRLLELDHKAISKIYLQTLSTNNIFFR